ncbi:putative quinol monooxygenase [Pelagibacterium xiamenense]|uniref:putative quinol monooxygenase n=1 Tax=Pelagibacterium xiamenense TaxID=2901140 RepID=UPI001E5DB2DE|nr:antibiotic biosynthesis monooxygenase [Pelagibacterium xiamenense]MCD7058302.1 antibiotic biosynthesis monooxygenase [Pelagibacterium xiamenense]
MVIVAGYLIVQPGERDDYVAAHADLVRRARTYPGCFDLSISADPVHPGRVNMYELWESEEELEAWRKIANPPETGSAFLDGQVQKHTISRSGPPF